MKTTTQIVENKTLTSVDDLIGEREWEHYYSRLWKWIPIGAVAFCGFIKQTNPGPGRFTTPHNICPDCDRLKFMKY